MTFVLIDEYTVAETVRKCHKIEPRSTASYYLLTRPAHFFKKASNLPSPVPIIQGEPIAPFVYLTHMHNHPLSRGASNKTLIQENLAHETSFNEHNTQFTSIVSRTSILLFRPRCHLRRACIGFFLCFSVVLPTRTR